MYNSIVVYRSPVEQIFWDTVVQNPMLMVKAILFVVLFIVVYYLLNTLYPKMVRSIPLRSRLSFMKTYRHYSTLMLFIAGVVSMYISFFLF